MTPAADPRSVTEVDAEIGARVRARRHELGLSQQDVADQIGVAFQQLQRYETGQSRIAASTLTRLAKALRTEPAQLLPGAGAPRRRQAKSEDAMALQLQHAFSRIRSKRERRLVLQLARQFAAEASERAPRKRRR